MCSYVKALYEFSGEPNSSEITISAGEILQVTRTDVGEGWWEGKKTNGVVGLFPEAYVEVMSAVDVAKLKSPPVPVVPPAPSAVQVQSPQSNNRYDDEDIDEDWDDDWDNDDNGTYSEIPQNHGTTNNNNFQKSSNIQTWQLPPTPHDDTTSLSSMQTGSGPLKKTGMFAKSSDPYILGTVHVAVPENEKTYIIQLDNFYFWQPNPHQYSVVVASPSKETKFKGMKSFIAYKLTPSFNQVSVSRRYKHFDWLHERLVDKFGLVIPIPPLPDKQISGRYEEQFIEHRRVQLQEFVDWMCRHPVLSKCEVWMHFLICNDEKKWKSGKRTAERDILTGVTYCSAVFPPEKQLLPSSVDREMESFSKFIHSMDTSVKNLVTISSDQIKRLQIQSKKDFQRVGEGLLDLAKALAIDEGRHNTTGASMANCVGLTGDKFIHIGQLCDNQPKADWIPFSDRLHIYR